jgi:hypothetical protein
MCDGRLRRLGGLQDLAVRIRHGRPLNGRRLKTVQALVKPWMTELEHAPFGQTSRQIRRVRRGPAPRLRQDVHEHERAFSKRRLAYVRRSSGVVHEKHRRSPLDPAARVSVSSPHRSHVPGSVSMITASPTRRVILMTSCCTPDSPSATRSRMCERSCPA